MGKWTPNYVDDVLHAKITTLVSGSVRRAAVERDSATTITYEGFIEELDTGDSFTASLIDILVKEIADRRSRSSANDKQRLSEKTIRNLRTLATNSQNFNSVHSHSNGGSNLAHRLRTHNRRTVNLSEYLTTAVPHEMDDLEDDDDDFDVLDSLQNNEGARSNTDMYFDPYPSTRLPHLPPRRTPATDPWSPPSASARPWSTLASGQTVPTASTSLLSRQASIRRLSRSRVDFNEYSQRRRAAMREAVASPPPEGPETVTEPREPPPLPWNSRSASSLPPSGRRFFPFPRSRRERRSLGASNSGDVYSWDFLSPPLSEGNSDEPMSHEQIMANHDAMWREAEHFGSTGELRDSGIDEGVGFGNQFRLRHATLRAPEVVRLAGTLAVPATGVPVEVSSGPSDAVEVFTASGSSYESPRLESTRAEESGPVAYPTPGSSESENPAADEQASAI